MDSFAALGLPDSATALEVRAAYHDKARSLHPDAGGDPHEFAVLHAHYTVALDRANNRPCHRCQGKKTVTLKQGWHTLTVKCPTCG